MRSVLRLLRVLEIERVTQRNVPGVMCQICIGSSVLENPGFCCPIVWGTLRVRATDRGGQCVTDGPLSMQGPRAFTRRFTLDPFLEFSRVP